MLLAVDSGNTRIKWALCDGAGTALESEAFPSGRISRLRKIAARATACRAAHVGGATREARLRAALSACADVAFLQSERRAGGVTNLYCPPESLGVDRWLSLLAVFALRDGTVGKGGKVGKVGTDGKGGVGGWVVVSAGTATTVDGLTADGNFIGGLILPGLSLFGGALGRATALPGSALVGECPEAFSVLPPRSTADAISHGAAHATVGAALEFRRRFLRGAEFILTGGDAERLSALLPGSRVIPDLTLRGLILRHFGSKRKV